MKQQALLRAFLGISHSPLIGLNPIPPETQTCLDTALAQARTAVARFAPELVVIVAPDHYNGFVNSLMPPFCVGTACTAVGDYNTAAGALNVDEAYALGLVEHLIAHDVDIAISRRMEVDHGFAQPLELLWTELRRTPPLIPIFMNAVAPPTIARVERCLRVGEAIGAYLDTLDARVLLIGSGGLSHEPPVPSLAHPDPQVRERITVKSTPTAEEREAKVSRVMAAGLALATGTSDLKPLNPEWDARWMDAIARGELNALCALGEHQITVEAGASAHESKTWLVARGALRGFDVAAPAVRFQRAIPEILAGFGVLFAEGHKRLEQS